MLHRSYEQRLLLERLWSAMMPVDGSARIPSADDWELRRLSDSSGAIFHELVNEFGIEELEASGIAVTESGDSSTFSPRLCGSDVFALPLTEQADEVPFDILLSDGLLLGGEPPFWALAHDYRISNHLREPDGFFLLVPQIEDVLICHTLGLAAAPIRGSSPLTRNVLNCIENLTNPVQSVSCLSSRIPSRAEEDGDGDLLTGEETEAAEEWNAEFSENGDIGSESSDTDVIELPFGSGLGVDLIVAEFSFVDVQRLDERSFRELFVELSQADRYSAVDLGNVAIWVPKSDDMERLQYARRLGDGELERTALLESIQDCCFSISSLQPDGVISDGISQTFCEARAALYRVMRDAHADNEDRDTAMGLFMSRLEREMIEPLIQSGIGHRDSVKGLLRLEAANLASFLQSHAPVLQAEIARNVSSRTIDQFASRLERRVRTHTQVLGTLIRLAREIHR